ncbi:MAG: KilA-N domain-containing protein [Saprospiraceae bacterium]
MEEIYGFTPKAFEYSSKRLNKVTNFVEEQHPQIMVMTLASFNSEDKILNQAKREDLFANIPFIEAIGRTNPIIIMDEPQEGMDTPNSIKQIAKLNPLFKIRYSVRIYIWEQINNPSFNSPEFEGIKNQAGLNRFTLSVKKWINATNAIGLAAKTGRYGGTFAHSDIAFEFGSWLSPEFKLYLIKEFKRLIKDENKILEWDFQRTLSKVNYKIHTDAIKENLIPKQINGKQTAIIYANEADVLNVALFGKTAKQWRDENPNEKGNIRDIATIQQLFNAF